MEKRTLKLSSAVGLFGVMLISVMITPVLAHHSFSMYDQTTERTLSGRLTRFIIGANHAQIIFELLDEEGEPVIENGTPVVWGFETGSAASLARRGITVESFQFGTVINVTINPLRDGRNFGAMTNTAGEIIKCGMVMPKGGCNQTTGEVFLRN